MSTYRLFDHGYPFKKIYHGKKWVGRVVQCADGRYYGRINLSTKGHLEAYGDTELAAFRAVASKALGFDNTEQLYQHNQRVRAAIAARNARARAWADRFTNGTLQDKMDVLDEVFDNLGSKRG